MAARIDWPGRLSSGWVIDAELIARTAGAPRGTARADSGEEILVDRLPSDASEGARLRIEITRAALNGPGRFKRAQGRPTALLPAQPSLAERLPARTVRRFPGSDWDELIDDALSGEIGFRGGTLLFAPTAAMTTVDIDGTLPPRELALAAIPELALSLRRLDAGGSIAVDFPTLTAKADRRAVDDALLAALADWPHERTAMNGFGLVQLVARLERASLLQLAAWQRPALVRNRLFRRAELLEGAGTISLTLHPRLARSIAPEHLATLERRTGRRVMMHELPSVALDAPHAQIISA